MKVKSGIIYNAFQTIMELSEKPMKVSLAAKLLRLIDDLRKESEFIEKQRKSIIEKYGKKDEFGELIIKDGIVNFEGNNAELVQNELNELSELEIEITDRFITEEELEQNNIELTINQFNILNNFLHKEYE